MYFKIKLPVTNHEGVIMLSTGKKFSRQMLIARISCHLHIFIYITHLTKIPKWKLFTTTPMEKSKSEKSPWVKKTKKTGPKKKGKAPFCQAKKKTLPKATKALGLAKRLRQARHLLKIRSFRKPFWCGFCFAFTFM